MLYALIFLRVLDGTPLRSHPRYAFLTLAASVT